MSIHLYLSLIPEALIASMLTPEEFGSYYAVGSVKKSRGQAIFFELDSNFRSDFFPMEAGIKRCVPHEDGTPKRSIYMGIYRVLENIPIQAIQMLYLVTQDGRTLGLEEGKSDPPEEKGMHLYREIAPVVPLVASALKPREFFALIVHSPTSLVKLPAICFTELRLGNLALDPQNGDPGDLPYDNLEHLRNCLLELRSKAAHTKMVDRTPPRNIAYRTVKNGFFVGNVGKLAYFALPPWDELKKTNYSWWRSAQM